MKKLHNKVPRPKSPDMNARIADGCGSFQTPQRGYRKSEIMQLIHRHKDFSQRLIREIEKIPEIILQTSATPTAKKVVSMVRELFKEWDRQRQFTRTSLSKKGILSGTISCRHRVEDWVLQYFHTRFPDFLICLFNELKGNTWVINETGEIHRYSEHLQLVISKLSKGRKNLDWDWQEWGIDSVEDRKELDLNDANFSAENLFSEFYSSQFIKKRENRRYFRHMIPKKMMKHPGLRGKIENRFQNGSLDIYTRNGK